jgi:hypothetical protein
MAIETCEPAENRPMRRRRQPGSTCRERPVRFVTGGAATNPSTSTPGARGQRRHDGKKANSVIKRRSNIGTNECPLLLECRTHRSPIMLLSTPIFGLRRRRRPLLCVWVLVGFSIGIGLRFGVRIRREP